MISDQYTRADISVIIPVFQDKDGLIDTVNSMIAQDFPIGQYEIIIADNNSQDGTKQTALDLQNAHPDLIKNCPSGPDTEFVCYPKCRCEGGKR